MFGKSRPPATGLNPVEFVMQFSLLLLVQESIQVLLVRAV